MIRDTGIFGMGTQGNKRFLIEKKLFLFTFDPYKKKNVQFSKLSQLEKINYKNIFLCIPDKIKFKFINFFLNKNKNILVEKPVVLNELQIKKIEKICKKKKLKYYTAYNHRFEPNIIQLKKELKKKIGKVYYVKMFYGNGTAKLVKDSVWKDKNNGILEDLGSHLLDTCQFLFPKNKKFKFHYFKRNKFENKFDENVKLGISLNKIFFDLGMSYCSWKNTFEVDVYATNCSIHLRNLCKWGQSEIKVRTRILPSGIPKEKIKIFNFGDPTWKREHNYFFKINSSEQKNIFKRDIWLSKIFNKIKKI